MSHSEAIENNYNILIRCTTIDLYVIDSLRAEDIVDEEQEFEIKTEKNQRKQRSIVFKWLKEVSSDRYESFLKVMKDTEQEHVANLLRGSTDENHLPLSIARYKRLEKIRAKMAKVTRTDTEVLAGLSALKAISELDVEEIKAEQEGYVKSSKLISAIMRRSNYSYNSFQEVLKKTLQKPAASYLNEGEMPAVHLNNNRPDLDEPLSLAFNKVITTGTANDAEINYLFAELNDLGLNPANGQPGESIVIFIYCKTIDRAVKFTQILNSGRLQHILGRIFNRLLLTIEPHCAEELDSHISLEDDDVISLEEFTGIEGCVRESHFRRNPLHRPKPCGRDATTQTDEQYIMKKFTEWSQIRRTEAKTSRQDLDSSSYKGELLEDNNHVREELDLSLPDDYDSMESEKPKTKPDHEKLLLLRDPVQSIKSEESKLPSISQFSEKMAGVNVSIDDIKKEEFDDMTTCSICKEVITDPKILPCSHTFCMNCLQECGFKNCIGPGDDMTCPICRGAFKIPTEGFRGLPKNIFVEKLIQKKASREAKVLCSVCLEKSKDPEEKEPPTAGTYCVDCRHKLCEECCNEHKQSESTKNHKLIPLDEYNFDQNVTTDLTSNACELHKQRVLDVFCADCKTVVCAICFVEHHKTHKGSHVDNYVDEFRKQIESNEEAMNKCRYKAQIKQTELLEVKEDLQKRVKKLECDVKNRVAELKQLVDKHATSLLQSLRSTRNTKQKEILMASDDIDAYILCLKTYNSYCQKIMNKGSAGDICGAFSNLTSTAVELKQQCQPMFDINIPSINYSFRNSELEKFLDASSDNFIGDFEGDFNSKQKKRSTLCQFVEQENQKKRSNFNEKPKQELNENEQLMALNFDKTSK